MPFFSRTTHDTPDVADDEDQDDQVDLSRIALEFTEVKSDGLHVASADVAHTVEPTEAESDELKREALEESSQPTPA